MKTKFHFMTDNHAYGGRATHYPKAHSTNYTNDPSSSEFHHLQMLSDFAERVRTNPAHRKSDKERNDLKRVERKGI